MKTFLTSIINQINKCGFLFIVIAPIVVSGQNQERDLQKLTPKPKARLIEQVEVFAGSGLCFNYGNEFVENYKDENVRNRRLLKVAYTFGVGTYHRVSDRIDINARFQYEIKGRKNELNSPITPDPGRRDLRSIDLDEYTYKYATVILSPRFWLERKRKSFISLGVYLSKIKGIEGYLRTYNTLDHQTDEGRFKGRYFYHLTEQGVRDSFTWITGLQSFETFDVGGHLSLGYSIPIKEKQFLAIQLTNNLGFTNINKGKPYGLEEKNHTVNLIVGYSIKRSPKK